ncbi:MAG: DUF4167 domain-containing protein [Candidatus Promineifilaceae bacterium]|jgi:hypothetical protein
MVSQKSRRPKTGTVQPRARTSRSPGRSNLLSSGGKGARPHGSAHPKSSYERYLALARASAASGDDVESENYLQHADHYFRLLKDKTA